VHGFGLPAGGYFGGGAVGSRNVSEAAARAPRAAAPLGTGWRTWTWCAAGRESLTYEPPIKVIGGSFLFLPAGRPGSRTLCFAKQAKGFHAALSINQRLQLLHKGLGAVAVRGELFSHLQWIERQAYNQICILRL
jgi:hypothetical protein